MAFCLGVLQNSSNQLSPSSTGEVCVVRETVEHESLILLHFLLPLFILCHPPPSFLLPPPPSSSLLLPPPSSSVLPPPSYRWLICYFQRWLLSEHLCLSCLQVIVNLNLHMSSVLFHSMLYSDLIPRPVLCPGFDHSLLFCTWTVMTSGKRRTVMKLFRSLCLAHTLPFLFIPHVPSHRRRGVIVNISSGVADHPMQLNTVYSATKVCSDAWGNCFHKR